MKTITQPKSTKHYRLILLLFTICSLLIQKVNSQVTFLESSKITDKALYFWKADDPKPFHYARTINPHGNCMKVSKGYVFYTWYRGGWADRTLMISRKKIGESTWVHVALPAKMSLVGGKGDTHLTTNVGISPIDGTVHLMFDHHNEDLNYIRSKKNIAYAPDSDFTAENFLPQQNYLIPGKKVTGVTYPDLFNNDKGEMYFERRLGSAVGGDIIMTYYNGNTWSPEKTIIRGRGASVSQGERHFAYGEAKLINGKFYYVYSPRWAESPTRLGEGVHVMELGERMDSKATTVDGKSYDLPITDHAPFLIANPRSVPDNAGWAGGPQLAISPKNDIYTYINPKGTSPYNHLRKSGETEFTEDRNKGSLGVFYGKRMYKFSISGGNFIVRSTLAGTYDWREDFRRSIGLTVRKSITILDDGYIAVVFSEIKNSPEIPVHCYVFKLEKEEYTPQTINFSAIPSKIESDADFTLAATASSNLPVLYRSSDTNIARIVDGNKVKIMGVGTCNIIASQPGNGNYDSAPEVSQTLVINANTSKTNQTISFNTSNKNYVWGSPEETLNATATSGLPVTYESSDTDVAVIVNGKLQVKRAGKTTINALQVGNATYNAAPIVGYELTVPKRKQVISLQDIPTATSGDPAFKLVASSNNPDAKLRFVAPNNQVVIVWSNNVRHLLGAGTATVTVSDTGNEYFTSAQVSKTITVKAKTHQIPTEIEAEHYTTKKGVNVTRWSNSVFYLNSWATNDYAEYTINVTKDGTYPLEIFAATPSTGRKLKIMKGSTLLKSVTLTKTPNLTRFLSTKTTITLQKGVQKIRIVGEVGGFNFDRMKIGNVTSGGGDTGGGNEGSDNIFWFRNLATGKFLGEGGGSALPVVMHNEAGDNATRWEITEVPATNFVNIDNMNTGILRATGGGFVAGAYFVVSTTKSSPAADADKVWTSHYNETDKTYRFEAGASGRFLYYGEDGNVITTSVPDTDARSKWQVLPTSQPLSVSNEKLLESSMRIYPNPSYGEFTIKFQNADTIKNLEIYNILGKQVYQNSSVNTVLKIDSARFAKGVYLVRAISKGNKAFYSKLIIK
ncbi:BNR-4 repeat-containing protein [Polaribacter septentrionalilitoris]|uniref:BNR-4 repeat-containing protein n=1 Tax=Polaribacter septentrionalilitoris TaxID=2494657 RepID=UPI0013574954|nr:BNR-4 repeat-containing protein [Polaribacter septentrionalilitoris]